MFCCKIALSYHKYSSVYMKEFCPDYCGVPTEHSQHPVAVPLCMEQWKNRLQSRNRNPAGVSCLPFFQGLLQFEYNPFLIMWHPLDFSMYGYIYMSLIYFFSFSLSQSMYGQLPRTMHLLTDLLSSVFHLDI